MSDISGQFSDCTVQQMSPTLIPPAVACRHIPDISNPPPYLRNSLSDSRLCVIYVLPVSYCNSLSVTHGYVLYMCCLYPIVIHSL